MAEQQRWIYSLWKGDHCLYVGQTTNIRDRIRRHRRDGKPWANLFDGFRIEAEGYGNVFELEKQVRAELDPIWNR